MMKSRTLSRAEQAVTWLMLLSLLFGLGYFLFYAGRAIRFPFPLDYGEGPLLNQARLLAARENIYRSNLTDYPYIIANYPPLYVSLLAIFSKLFGLSYAVGRTISVISALMSAIFIVLILHVFTRDRVASAVGGLLFLISPYVVRWSPLARVDLLALAFSLAGILVASRWLEKRWSPLVSALLMMGAVFTRQSYLLAGPLAVAGWLFIHDRRKVGIFIITLVVGTLSIFLALNWLTRGGFFFHTVVANANRILLSQLTFYLTHLIISSLLLIAIAVMEVVSAIQRRQKVSVFLSLYLAGGFLSALTVGKVGSNVNYLLEFVAALCLSGGVVMARWRQLPRVAWGRLLVSIVLMLQVIWLLRVDRFYVRETQRRFDTQSELEQLEQIVRREPNPALADEYMGILVMSQQELLLQPFEFTQLAREGKWNQGRLIADLQAGRFGLILISDQPPLFSEALVRSRWSEEMRAAIEEAYQPTEVLAGTTLYRPQAQR